MARLVVAFLSLALLAVTLAAPPAVEAQPTGKMYRIGMISPAPLDAPGDYFNPEKHAYDRALVQGLRPGDLPMEQATRR